MKLAKYKACICEGSAESAIIDILIDNDLLIFSREELLEESVIRCRNAKRFEERYLRKSLYVVDFSVCDQLHIFNNQSSNFERKKLGQHQLTNRVYSKCCCVSTCL